MKRVLTFLLLFLTGCIITGNIVKEPQTLNAAVYFCPETNCMQLLINYFDLSDKINCAFYDIDKRIIEHIKTKNTRIITDDHSKINYSFTRKDNNNQLMHNKFCILDDKTIITGSFNPTIKGEADYNNIIIINSKAAAVVYQAEFEELWNGFFGKGEKTTNNVISYYDAELEIYFCPEDSCAEKVENELSKAQKSIYFMTYSFTHGGIANSLIIKHSEGIDVKGIYEKSQGTKYSKYKLLNYQNISIKPDKTKNLIHHKVFIIDNATVITGSFNPTENADENNDENLLIIRNERIAKQYADEFERLWSS